MNKAFLAVALNLLICAVAAGQDLPAMEIFGGYSLARIGISQSNLNAIGSSVGLANVQTSNLQRTGVESSVTFNLNPHVGLESDFRWNQGTILRGAVANAGTVSANLRSIAFLFGPVFVVRHSKAISPFVHALAGADITTISAKGTVGSSGIGASASASNTGYALVVGGGVNIRVNGVVAIRLGPDYVRTRAFGTDMNNLSLSSGVNLRFGGR